MNQKNESLCEGFFGKSRQSGEGGKRREREKKEITKKRETMELFHRFLSILGQQKIISFKNIAVKNFVFFCC